MKTFDEEIAQLLDEIRGKGKRNNEKLSSSFRTPQIHNKQVVVKMISNIGAVGAKNALKYILTHSFRETLEDELGNEKSVEEVLKDWGIDFSKTKTILNGKVIQSREAWHLTFGIDEENTFSNINALKKSVRDAMEANFFEYRYVMVEHMHQSKPHVHVIVNKRNKYTGKKLHFKGKDEIREFFNKVRTDFADALNVNGSFQRQYENRYAHDRSIDIQKLQEQAGAIAFEQLEKKLEPTLKLEYIQWRLITKIENLDAKINEKKRKIAKIEIKELEDKKNMSFDRIKQYTFQLEKLVKEIQELETPRKKYFDLFQKNTDAIKAESDRIFDHFSNIVAIQRSLSSLSKNKELSLRDRQEIEIIRQTVDECLHDSSFAMWEQTKSTKIQKLIATRYEKGAYFYKSAHKLIQLLRESERNLKTLEAIEPKNKNLLWYKVAQLKNIEDLRGVLKQRYELNLKKTEKLQLGIGKREEKIGIEEYMPLKKRYIAENVKASKQAEFALRENRLIQKYFEINKIKFCSNRAQEEVHFERIDQLKEFVKMKENRDR